ncbi:hypothetical protein DL796_06930 [Kangiella spongicola]|uniref:Uncharacterized protein n=2 Tax=Kangiella spongicola TaxID=796379 RepID=A0A318D5K1_9GAMM|nr:hypothetical protein DL796_06930 [Kangiella spongicola]
MIIIHTKQQDGPVMKAFLISLMTIFLVVLFVPASVMAASDNSKLTQEEAQLWKEFFGESVAQNSLQKSEATVEDSVNLTGQWIGYYEYDMPKGQPDGAFTAVMKDLGDEFSMTFLEPRNHPSEYVQAAITLDPKRQGKYLSFTKSYSNSDTVIQYNLVIRHSGMVMDGTWRINDNVYGRAFFYRLKLDELKELKQQTEI